MARLEIWGGVECTATRAGERVVDQTRRSGHHDRIEDLDLFASLGMQSIRYPVLWERVAPDRPDVCDWSWTDARLARLDALGLRVIAGLVHHGGGPHYTNLLDDGFPTGVARHAAGAARRYPHVRDWTPINEPVTTARFAALYGVWHPHKADEESFWRALLNEVDATRLAMRTIREVTPDARLIQTDDLGRTYATVPLAEQAAFDNTRRWMGWDLLFGRVTPSHPMWHRLCSYGLGERLRAIADDPCPPDIVGINHYLTSDRFLDHRVERYPPERVGGNGRDHYADLEPVRALTPAPDGFATAIRDAWERYRAPIAITEVHNGCTREEQMRWVVDAWSAAVAARASGVDVRAVTAWALLGSHDWDRLLTEEGAYEPGLFDVSSGTVRETALAELWRSLAQQRVPEIARAPGWWRRPERLLHPATPRAGTVGEHRVRQRAGRPLLVIGEGGAIEQALIDAARVRGVPVRTVDPSALDRAHTPDVAWLLDDARPWAVVSTAEATRSSQALARECAARAIAFVQLSSARVFDGSQAERFDEAAVPAPTCPGGYDDYAAEQAALAAGGSCLVVRTGEVLAKHQPSFASFVLHALRVDGELTLPAGPASFAFAPAVAAALLDAVIDGETGVRHFVHDQAPSRAELARLLAAAAGFAPAAVRIVETEPAGGAVLHSRDEPRLGPLAAAAADLVAAFDRSAAMPLIVQEIAA